VKAGKAGTRKEQFLALALELAEKGRGFASPNPMVGAVVEWNGFVIGTGYHARYGDAHAEVNAIQDAGKEMECAFCEADALKHKDKRMMPRGFTKGTTLYVSLEPCCHWGKQPPCVDAIVRAGIKKVVYALQDPNPLVRGKGHKALEKAGIRVEKAPASSAAAAAARELNKAYLKRMEISLPYVVLKVAMSADGKIAGQKGKWISGPEERAEVQWMRAHSDAVLVGINTALKDDPRLTARMKGAPRRAQPLRVVLDSRLRLSPKARLLKEKGSVLVLTTRKARAAKRRALEKKGAEVVVVKGRAGRVDLRAALKELGKRMINEVLVEGGQKLGTALLAQGLVDELCLAVSPREIGPKGLDAFDFRQLKGKKIRFGKMDVRKLGRDLMVKVRLA